MHSEPRRALRLVIFGCALDTGNLGVSALGYSVLYGLGQRLPEAKLTSFDHSPGIRAGEVGGVAYEQLGAYRTRRIYAPHSHAAIGAALRLGLPLSPAAERIRNADAILDISGGDSFTDLYGPERLKAIAWPKLMAMRMGKPLILLPQTYGPFRSSTSRELAARICRGTAAAWARDEKSFGVLRDLLGDAFDPERHRSGVDVAFLLPTQRPVAPSGDRLQEWLKTRNEAEPLVGLNISGLLYNDPDGARSRYGFIADYRELCRRLVSRLAADGARVVLTPHVVSPTGHYESDIEASEHLAASLPAAVAARVTVAPAFLDPREVKWLIGQYDWFCGTRMHSTIAGLSSGVPTATTSYSDKAQGVFESCGAGDAVVDPRRLGTDQALDGLHSLFHDRRELAGTLHSRLPSVLKAAEERMDAIAACICRPPTGGAG
ncbi:hypothetical protein Thimo_3077 [Thioflavicoccus mobilis 8321]|uniref:Polysaccharide pyruvyl transferase domain-containing protein n=1 Tax=Thioflavicoccus mobilis 8321 TaxID=765912 RepID=L0GYB6_9GAMM|nr:hypothetical protein Thimo_3077 [Thioflavicoccus mobilis 8321]